MKDGLEQKPTIIKRDLLISLATLALGGAVVFFLTSYNLAGKNIWSAGTAASYYSWEEYLLVNITALLFIPVLFIFLCPGESAEKWGFRKPESGAVKLAWLFFVLMLPFLFIASHYPEFRAYYPIQKQAIYSFRYFIYFELTYGFYLFCWEYFYRGFLTFGLARRFGELSAVLLQAVAFGLMHWGKPLPEFAGSFIAGLALGWLAIRARSFIPGFALHWFNAVLFDMLAIHAQKNGIF